MKASLKQKSDLKEAEMEEMVQNRHKVPPTPWQENLWILPTLDESGPLQLSSTGMTLNDPKYRIKRSHGATYYVLECILEGEGHLFAGGEHYRPAAGDVYLLPPGMPNEYYTLPEAPWKKVWFNVYGPLIDSLVECYRLSGVVFIRHAELEDLFLSTMELVKAGGVEAAEGLALALHKIFYRMGHLHRLDFNGISQEAQQLKEYLDSNWELPYSLKKLSGVIYRSPNQTLRIFKNAFHMTPLAYHALRKQQCAMQFLRNTSYSIRMIADYLGFANEFSFSNWFKSHVGCAPKFYRLKEKAAEDTQEKKSMTASLLPSESDV